MAEVTKIYQPITNYLYLYHTNTLIILPNYPENMTDAETATFAQNSPLGRSAPIYAYSYSGPRTISFQFELHREMLDQVNGYKSGESIDMVDTMVREVQAAVLPNYAVSQKMVDPPLVACRVGNEIYIKGVINGSVSIGYAGPIMYNDKYALCNIGFTITEVDPYDAEIVQRVGSFRYSGDIALNTSMDQNVYKAGMSMSGGGAGKVPMESSVDRMGLFN